MNIGFDLDGIFIDIHPIIPKKIIEWLYRGPQDHEPSYRFPTTKLEQKIRKLSHYYIFRPKISKNIKFLKNLSSKKHKLFLISSRFSFLGSETDKILKKYNIKNSFSKIYLNSRDLQPHIFKEGVLKKLLPDIFIEDDLMLLKYLAKCYPEIKLLWYNPNNVRKSYAGITHIKSLKELQNYLK